MPTINLSLAVLHSIIDSVDSNLNWINWEAPVDACEFVQVCDQLNEALINISEILIELKEENIALKARIEKIESPTSCSSNFPNN